MRQIGTLPDERQARTLVDYLLVQGIEAQVEAEAARAEGAGARDVAGAGASDAQEWAVWIREENQVDAARAMLEEFRAGPADAKYREATAEAEARRSTRRRQAVPDRVVDMRREWNRPLRQRSPVTFTLILLCVFASLATNFGQDIRSLVFSALAFCEPEVFLKSMDGLAQVKSGQVWRLVTPVFLHGDVLHLFFNMWWLYGLGPQIESRRGPLRFMLLVVLLAVASNLLQFFFSGPNFLGFSGVVYGFLGFIWSRKTVDPRSTYLLSEMTVLFMLGYFALGFLGDFASTQGSGIANWSHAGGLVAGLVLGYLPFANRSGE